MRSAMTAPSLSLSSPLDPNPIAGSYRQPKIPFPNAGPRKGGDLAFNAVTACRENWIASLTTPRHTGFLAADDD